MFYFLTVEQLPKAEELEGLQTTLLVSTVFPHKDSSEEFLEVATIRSPYTFDIENSQKSTRYRTGNNNKKLDFIVH